MTLKMPSLDGFPSYVADQYASDGIIPLLRRPLRVQYSADTLDVTIPDHVAPTPYDGGGASMDVTNARQVLFTDSDGNFWSIEQSRLQFLQTLSATFYVMFRRTARGWKRWQPRLGPPAPPISGITGICFRNGATIQLVAGGTLGASFDSFSPTDGPLGTNVITSPYAVAFNPFDGLVYFNDNSVNLRTWSPLSGLVATAVHGQQFWNGGFWLGYNSALAFGGDGTGYQWGVQDDDEPSTLLIRTNPDGTFDTSLVGGSVDVYHGFGGASKNVRITGIGGLAVSHTGATRVFFGITGSISDDIAQDGGSPVENGANVSLVGYYDYNTDHDDDDDAGHVVFVGGVYFPAGNNGGLGGSTNYPSPTTSGDSSSPVGTSSTDQGEGTGVDQPLIGQIVDLCLGPGDEVHTVGVDVHMVRKMALNPDTHVYDGAVSLTNHTAIDFESGIAGFPVGGGPSGDGLPAFTSPGYVTTPQFGGPNSIAMSDCGGPVILDGGTVRYIDPVGNLFTVAGDPTGASPLPDSTPADALTRSFSGAKITKIGRGRYIISQVGNDPFPDALYLLVDKQCLTPTPTIRIVAGGQPSDDEGQQIDGALGTNSLEGTVQMCWGPDGKIWIGASGFSPDGEFNTDIRTYDPITGLVATLPFHAPDGDRGVIIGICCSAAGNVYFIVNSTDDSNTTYLCKVPFGATSPSDVTALHFFIEFAGSASAFGNIGVVTNPDGKEFVILSHITFSEVMYYDVTENVLSQYMMSYSGAPSTDADNPDMGEHVEGNAGVLGNNLRGNFVTASGQVVTGSYINQVIRTAQISFQDDGSGGTVPQADDLYSITNHSLYPSGDPAGYGGDGTLAYVEGDYGPKFDGITAVAVDSCGNYYAIDYNNGVVRMVDANGILHTIAGDGDLGFEDGAVFPGVDPVLATTVSIGLAFTNGGAMLPDPAGGLYLASNNALYKLES